MRVSDIPDAWDAAMQELLGLSTAGNYKDGCMQDVHWPSAGIGYFPTYTLGAITAAQLKASLVQEIPDMGDQIARGDLAPTMAWLKTKIWSQGSLQGMQELLKTVTGKTLDAEDFKAHLSKRYLED